VSTPWGGADRGPCDKCEGAGRVEHRCLSCIEAGTDPECAACGGRVEWVDVCPACEGDGEITRVKRRGVSAFPSLPGLYRYLAEREADLSGSVFLELQGELSGDRDLDADDGAVLVVPRRIAGIHQVDERRLSELTERG
jgi:RecJ-like exonuclease